MQRLSCWASGLLSLTCLLACSGSSGLSTTQVVPIVGDNQQVFETLAGDYITALQVGDSARLHRISVGPGIAPPWGAETLYSYTRIVPDAWAQSRQLLDTSRMGRGFREGDI